MVYGVGYIKDIRITKDVYPYYERWRYMLGRCYYPKNGSYKKYGGKGVIVSEDWKCFDANNKN